MIDFSVLAALDVYIDIPALFFHRFFRDIPKSVALSTAGFQIQFLFNMILSMSFSRMLQCSTCHRRRTQKPHIQVKFSATRALQVLENSYILFLVFSYLGTSLFYNN